MFALKPRKEIVIRIILTAVILFNAPVFTHTASAADEVVTPTETVTETPPVEPTVPVTETPAAETATPVPPETVTPIAPSPAIATVEPAI